MNVNSSYVLVEKVEEPKVEGFQKLEVQDNYLYKGRIVQLPEVPVFVDNHRLGVGEVVLFAKYSPDTHEQELDGKKLKFVLQRDLLAVL